MITNYKFNAMTIEQPKVKELVLDYLDKMRYVVKHADLSIGFHRDRGMRQQELNNNKNIYGTYHLRNMLKEVFGFAEQKEKATYGLGYKLILTRISDNSVLKIMKIMKSTLVKLKLIVLISIYHILHHQFPNKLHYLNKL